MNDWTEMFAAGRYFRRTQKTDKADHWNSFLYKKCVFNFVLSSNCQSCQKQVISKWEVFLLPYIPYYTTIVISTLNVREQVRIQSNISILRIWELGLFRIKRQTLNTSEDHLFFVKSSQQILQLCPPSSTLVGWDHTTFSGCKSSAPCPDAFLPASAGRQHAPSH